MAEQLDLFPETLSTPVKQADDTIEIYMGLWRAERRVATLRHLLPLIHNRLDMEDN